VFKLGHRVGWAFPIRSRETQSREETVTLTPADPPMKGPGAGGGTIGEPLVGDALQHPLSNLRHLLRLLVGPETSGSRSSR
jgi:hypothetical protein